MVYYITATRKARAGQVQKIQAYRLSIWRKSDGVVWEREDFFKRRFDERDIYYAYNPKTRQVAPVAIATQSKEGKPYLKTKGQVITETLLQLPEC